MLTTRAPAVAGTFYPGQSEQLAANVNALLRDARVQIAASPKALIVPHAGYVYSGSTAAAAYASLLKNAADIRRVVLLGPVHRVPVRGLALPSMKAFATPLGTVELDVVAITNIQSMPQVVTSEAAHRLEHSLEVQLPFLQTVLDDFKLVPLAVGDASPEEVAEVLEKLWGGPETLLVISSDLSHFHAYHSAQQVDRKTVDSILDLRTLTSYEQACGAAPINGLLLAARHHALQPTLLNLCNSGDTAGDKQRVVGYASFVFCEAPINTLQENTLARSEKGRTLLAIARAAISKELGRDATADESAAWLHEPGACFITLMQNGELRGCIGSLEPRRSLLDDIKANARAAAFSDPRFSPLSNAELDEVVIEVSLLSPIEPLQFATEADALAQLRPHIDGIVFKRGYSRSTFLPQVWEQLPTPHEFMAHLKVKAGLSANFWSNDVELYRYVVTKFKESQ